MDNEEHGDATMQILMTTVKGVLRAHSINDDLERAESWRQCLEHDGHDASICELSQELWEECLYKRGYILSK